ncbi:MAG TPA: hypothetical protein VFJ19_12525 [Nocardioidaceae bacterium]|nr:hypothetical protein [Nocardioidaceae bacterium]
MTVTRSRMARLTSLGAVAATTLSLMSTPVAADAAQSHTIQVYITKHRVVHMTSGMHPGVHRFEIRSGKVSAFQLAWVRRGYSDRELARDAAAGPNGGDLKALKRFTRNVTLLGGVTSVPGTRTVMYVDLHRGGRYVAVDTNAPDTPFHHFSVGGQRVSGQMPATRTIRAVGEDRFAARPHSIARHGLLTFVNKSDADHFITTGKLLPGKTVKDFAAWTKDPSGPPPIDESVQGLETGVVSPGHRFAFSYSGQKAGRYVLTCFWSDVDTGMPHAFMGMYRGITVR